MKKKHSLLTKLKVCWYWLFKHGNGIGVTCSICGSTRLTIIAKSGPTGAGIYTSRYKCRDCGATARNIEVWGRSN